jgi:hypothetical protein
MFILKRRRAVFLYISTACCTLIFYSCVLFASQAEDQNTPVIRDVIPLPQNWLDASPVRGKPQLTFYLTQFLYKCNECHIDLKTPTYECDKYVKMPTAFHLPLGAHRDMVFNHGINMRCFNCHNCANLETYIDYDGSEIPADRPVLLCRKCHGTTYRDWAAGVHGRINGYWDTSGGAQEKLECNQCHNPHHPHFPLLVPRPPPSQARIPHIKKGKHREHE